MGSLGLEKSVHNASISSLSNALLKEGGLQSTHLHNLLIEIKLYGQ